MNKRVDIELSHQELDCQREILRAKENREGKPDANESIRSASGFRIDKIYFLITFRIILYITKATRILLYFERKKYGCR